MVDGRVTFRFASLFDLFDYRFDVTSPTHQLNMSDIQPGEFILGTSNLVKMPCESRKGYIIMQLTSKGFLYYQTSTKATKTAKVTSLFHIPSSYHEIFSKLYLQTTKDPLLFQRKSTKSPRITIAQIQAQPTARMPLSPEDQKLADSIIVVAHLFVYDEEWQDIPYYIHLHLRKQLPNKEIYDEEGAKKRWEELQKEPKGAYADWSGKKRNDKEVWDFRKEHDM